jgi:hypothetical protein
MAQELLNGADIAAIFEEMSGEGVAKSIRILLMNRPFCGFATATIHSSALRFSWFVPFGGLTPTSS